MLFIDSLQICNVFDSLYNELLADALKRWFLAVYFILEVLQSLEFGWQGVPCLNVQRQDQLYMNTAAL